MVFFLTRIDCLTAKSVASVQNIFVFAGLHKSNDWLTSTNAEKLLVDEVFQGQGIE